MKYYIEGSNKSDFYHVGTYDTKLKVFEKGRGWHFIMSFLSDYPNLLDEIIIVDENDNTMEGIEFFKHILKPKENDIN